MSFAESEEILEDEMEGVIDDTTLQDDLDLIAIIEANPRIYNKGSRGYKNTKDKDMAFVSIGAALHVPLSGSAVKARRNTLRTLYGRQRRLMLHPKSGDGGHSDSKPATPQFEAIHRFLANVYVPRKKTVSNISICTEPIPINVAVSNQLRANHTNPTWKNDVKAMLAPDDTTSGPSIRTTSSDISAETISSTGTAQRQLGRRPQSSPTVPPLDGFAIKRKKAIDTAETAIANSLAGIKELTSDLRTHVLNQNVQSTEDKAMVTVLIHGLQRVPPRSRTRALVDMLTVLEKYEDAPPDGN